ncbi:MAG: HEAT repeat domain-containing protein [Candidatus Heimdallarchaeota archaeon]|nr:HEAT repeat domain-containing protein [Candidatus Heimdallarchaeota archaeon]
MDPKLEKRLKKFNNSPDVMKLKELFSISEQEIDENNLEFLIKVVEKEKYERVRIKAILILKDTKKREIAQKLMEFYAYERENSVKLVLVEAIGDMSSPKIDDFMIRISKEDENDIVRSMAIRKLHDRGKLKKDKIRNLLLEVIQNDKDVSPIQMSLNIIPNYAESESLETLKRVYRRETKNKLRLLIYQTMSKIAEILDEDLGIKEPILEVVRDESGKAQKKKRRRRKTKKKAKDEEHLFF